MVATIEFAKKLRDQLSKLDLNNPQHKELYERLLFSFIKENEKELLYIYNDGKNNNTISVGFNMQNPGAKKIWYSIFDNSISFDKVKNGKQSITHEQSRLIYNYIKNSNRKELINLYGFVWNQLTANVKVMIEDLYWHGSNKLVGRKTKFYKNIMLYAKTFNIKYLEEALIEVREHSNRERNTNIGIGIQNRRNAQSEMGKISLR